MIFVIEVDFYLINIVRETAIEYWGCNVRWVEVC